MTKGLATTFGVLTTTVNEAAVRVLLPALDSPHRKIREGALVAVLGRRTPAGHREILRRLPALDAHAFEIVHKHSGRLASAIREALLSDDPQLFANACQAMVRFREFDLIPVLLNVLENSTEPNGREAAKTLVQLIDLLEERISAQNQSEERRDPQLVRHYVATALEHSIERFVKHKRREVVEAFLLLCHRDNATLRQILQTPYHPAFLIVIEILSKSAHPAVIGLLLGFLDDAKTPSGAVSLVSKRTDLKFIQSLLRKIGREPSPAVSANLKRMDSIAWVRSGPALLDQLDDAAQHAAVRIVMASGTPRAEAFAMIEYLLLYGKTSGRRAASKALDEFHGANANALALKALEDKDPQVQANVALQLRGRGIPGTLPRLVGMVDSEHAVVRKAARKSLEEFSFKRFLAAFDMLDDDVRRSTGLLVKKVDPQTFSLLADELESPARPRRLRGLAIVRAIDGAAPLEAVLLRLTGDEDYQVRAEAAAALAFCESAASRDALRSLLSDRSPSVCEAARRSLEEQADFAAWRGQLAALETEPFPKP